MPGADIGVIEVLYSAIHKARDYGIELRAVEIEPQRWEELREEIIRRARLYPTNRKDYVLGGRVIVLGDTSVRPHEDAR